MIDLRITQKPVHFKLEVSKKDSPTTSFAGLALIRESLKRLGLAEEMKQFLLKKAGYADEIVIEALILLIAAGGRSLSDWDYLCKEEGFVRFFDPCPSVDTLERYLRRLSLKTPERSSNKGQVGYAFQLEYLHTILIQKAYQLSGSPKQLTADIDTTITYSENREAEFTYDKEKGYQPMMVYCPELAMVIAHEFRDGNVSPAEGYDRLFVRCRKMFPEVSWTVRSDAAGYQLASSTSGSESRAAGSGLEWLDAIHTFLYYVTAKQCDTMLEILKKETSWIPLIKDGIKTEQEISEIAYVPTFSLQEQMRSRRGQRFIATRKKRKQLDVWEGEYIYQVIVTNDANSDLCAIMKTHRGRCGSIEFANAEIKNGCGMDHMPANSFSVNAAWFSLGVMTHNLLKLIQNHILPETMKKIEIKTLRFRLMRLAAIVIKKAKQTILRFSKNHPAFEIYQKAWANLQVLA